MTNGEFAARPGEKDVLEQLARLGGDLVELDREVQRKREELQRAEKRATIMASETIPRLIVEHNVPIPAEGLKIPTRYGFSIVVKEEVHGGCSKANMPALIRWLDANGESGMVKRELILAFNRDQSEQARELEARLRPDYPMIESKETVNMNTLKAWIRRRLEAGENLPEVVTFDVTRRAKVV